MNLKKIALCFLLSLFSISSTYAAFPDDLDDVVFVEEATFGGAVGLTEVMRAMTPTAELEISIAGTAINLFSSKRNDWPRGGGNLGCCNANAWFFQQVDGIWYAATWEFLRQGQVTKSTDAIVGPRHLRYFPWVGFRFDRAPEDTIFGFMVAGITRAGIDRLNIAERSEIAFWKVGTGPISQEEAVGPVASEIPNITPAIDLLQNDAFIVTPPLPPTAPPAE